MKVGIFVPIKRSTFVPPEHVTPVDMHLVISKHIEMTYDVLRLLAVANEIHLEKCLSPAEMRILITRKELILVRERALSFSKCMSFEKGWPYVVLRIVEK